MASDIILTEPLINPTMNFIIINKEFDNTERRAIETFAFMPYKPGVLSKVMRKRNKIQSDFYQFIADISKADLFGVLKASHPGSIGMCEPEFVFSLQVTF